ncbi:ROK family protein [Longispora albida]|uniref:ROK family protein n=1 Tax=Longispora albida TaxID=203523 RepID=UPI000364CF5C|nr:ROK family protein [Longispora albida]
MGSSVVAIDVGGTGMKCALVDTSGRVLHVERHATGRERGPDAVLETIGEVAAGLVETARAKDLTPEAVGVVVPGVVNETDGIAVYSSNIGWHDAPLRTLIEERTGLTAALGHDVRAGALAEARIGAGREYDNVLFIPIGTGIASGLAVRGTVRSGAHGAAGEIGHLVIRPGGPLCGCGQHGCLEALASASSVARRYGENKTAAEVAALAQAGDQKAIGVWQDTVDALADGLLAGIVLLDPEIIVIGGGLAEAGDLLLAPLAVALDAKRTFHARPHLVRAALGDEAGCIGAALLALDRLGHGGDGR